jgi:hypothetical protein
MILNIAIITIGVFVFVVPELVSVLRRARHPPSGEERRLLEGERQRRLAAERGELTGAPGSGCPWCGFPIPPRG